VTHYNTHQWRSIDTRLWLTSRTRRAFSVRLLIALTGVVLSVLGCSPPCPRPGFVGVPEALERSPDFALPLDPEDQKLLLGFLFHGGRRPSRSWSPQDEDPGRLQHIQDKYGKLLAALTQKAPTKEDLQERTGALTQLFDDPRWLLAVHDARVEKDQDGAFYDLDPERVRGLVQGDFVFAFYTRRLTPLAVTAEQAPGLGRGEHTIWVLGDEHAGGYTGLVVFRKTFALPIRAE
jgi:hypothetical protein